MNRASLSMQFASEEARVVFNGLGNVLSNLYVLEDAGASDGAIRAAMN